MQRLARVGPSVFEQFRQAESRAQLASDLVLKRVSELQRLTRLTQCPDAGLVLMREVRVGNRIAQLHNALGLKFAVLTSVNRDDLPDGGAAHLARTIRAIRRLNPGVGVEVLSPTTNPRVSPVATGSGAASSVPAATGAPDPNNGLSAVGPKDATALPPVEQAAPAPDQVNEVAGQPQPKPATSKSEYDKTDESSSKHQPKKGLDKLNPF